MSQNEILISFINRLSRKPLSRDTAEYIRECVLVDLQHHYGDTYKWAIVSITSTLKFEDHNVILLHQDEHPDVKVLIQFVRETLLGFGLKIS